MPYKPLSLAYHLTHLLASDASKTRCPALVLSLSVVTRMCAKSNVKKRKMTAQPGTVPAAPTATPPQIHNTLGPTLRYEAIPVRGPRSGLQPCFTVLNFYRYQTITAYVEGLPVHAQLQLTP